MATATSATAPAEELSPDNTPVFDLTGVSFAWKKSAPPLLEIAHFALHRHESLFLVGPSGSGKSTLLGLLSGVLRPQQGTITILGENVTAMGAAKRDAFRADHMGVIFQQFNLIPALSPLENVTLPCHFSARRAERAGGAQREAEARRLLARLDFSEAMLAKPVVELSVGQQQRVAAARALLGRPELIIADEPTSSLDNARRQDFLQLLFAECDAAGSALLFVSHDTTLATLFDRTVSLAELNTGVQS